MALVFFANLVYIKGSSKSGEYPLTRDDLLSLLTLNRDKKIIDAVDVETPPWRREAKGLWMDVPKKILDLMTANGMNPAEAIHAAEHAFLNRFVLGNDMGTECKAAEKEYKSTETKRKRPARSVGTVLTVS